MKLVTRFLNLKLTVAGMLLLVPVWASNVPDSLSYRVQIGARYGVPLSPEAFSEMIREEFKIMEGQHMGWYKYTVGHASSFDSALRLTQYITDRYNINGPFVAKYIFGYRIPIAEVFYKVQIAASYKKPLSIYALKRKYDLEWPLAEEYYDPYYKYLTGSFLEFDSAVSFIRDLKDFHGIIGAFVVPYYLNKRVVEPDSFTYFVSNEGYLNRLPDKPREISTSAIEESRETAIEEDTAITPVETRESIIETEEPKEEKIREDEPEQKSIEQEPVKPVRKDVVRESIRSWVNINLSPGVAVWISHIIDLSYKSLLILVFSIVVVFLLLNLVVVFFFIIFNKIRREYMARRIKRLQAEYQELLTDYLFDEENEAVVYFKLSNVRNYFKIQILIDEFLRMYFNVSGEADKKLHDLFIRLNLHKDSMRRLKKFDWTKKAKAFREITMMNIQEAGPYIEQYINAKNDTLRSEAQIAMVRLNEDDPFSFLDKLEEDFTHWEQLNVHAIVRAYNITIPDFSRWFGSENDTVVIFAVKMTTIYQQTDSFMELLDLTRHESEKVRNEVIVAIGKMQMKEGIPKLLSIYSAETYNNKLQILKALQSIPDESEIGFLVDKAKEEDFDIQLNALKVLNNIGFKGQQIIEELSKGQNITFKEKVKHVKDKRI